MNSNRRYLVGLIVVFLLGLGAGLGAARVFAANDQRTACAVFLDSLAPAPKQPLWQQ